MNMSITNTPQPRRHSPVSGTMRFEWSKDDEPPTEFKALKDAFYADRVLARDTMALGTLTFRVQAIKESADIMTGMWTAIIELRGE